MRRWRVARATDVSRRDELRHERRPEGTHRRAVSIVCAVCLVTKVGHAIFANVSPPQRGVGNTQEIRNSASECKSAADVYSKKSTIQRTC